MEAAIGGKVAKQNNTSASRWTASQLSLCPSQLETPLAGHGPPEAHRNLPRPPHLPMGSRRRRGIGPPGSVGFSTHIPRNISDSAGLILSGCEPVLAQVETS